MAILAALLPYAAAGARFASALDGHHQVIHASSWKQLLRLVMRHPVDLCVLDPYDPFRPVSFQQLQRLRRKHPDLAILVYTDFTGRESDLFDLGRLQVHGVLQATGHESRRRVQAAVDRGLARAVAARVVRTLEGRLPPLALDCIGWAIEHAEEQPRVVDLARAVSVSPRMLARDLRAQDLPTACRLLLWGRLLQAARLLESPGATVDQVAFRVGYATGGALRRALNRLCGCAPGELKRRGGLTAAMEAFLAELTCMEASDPDRPAGNRPRSAWWLRDSTRDLPEDSLLLAGPQPPASPGNLPPGNTSHSRSRRPRSRPVVAVRAEGGDRTKP